jgi:phenylalanyl-tRNA synthetase beta chain
MEYPLHVLNKQGNLKSLRLAEIIDVMNLIGFEIDDIFIRKSSNSKFTDDINLVIKTPSNREDLLNETFLLSDFSKILLFQLYTLWEKSKKNYSFLLKQKYKEYSNYKIINIQSDLSDIIFYQIKIREIKNYDSPLWVQNKLINSGIKANKNLTDITELVQLEWGQAFTLLEPNSEEQLRDINISKSYNDGIFYSTENEKTHLKKGTIILKNKNNKVIDVLGNLKNVDLTKEDKHLDNDHLIIRSIFYDIHQNKLLINSLNSAFPLRYLRKLFLTNLRFSVQRLLTLFEIIANAKIEPTIYSFIPIDLSLKKNNILKISKNSFKKFLFLDSYDRLIFEKAGLKLICKTTNELYIQIPNFRKDLTREIDILEEYARFVGYDNFPEILPNQSSANVIKNDSNKEFVKQFFLTNGFNEVLTNPIVDIENRNNSSINIANPLNSELSNLRTELSSQLLDIFQTNFRLQCNTKKFFEIGRIFKKRNGKIVEKERLAAIFKIDKGNLDKSYSDQWFIAKGFIESFLINFNIFPNFVEHEEFKESIFHSTRSVSIHLNGKVIGIFGELNPKKQKVGNSKFSIYLLELDFDKLENKIRQNKIQTYRNYSKYPTIIKDLSIAVGKNINFTNLRTEIETNCFYLKKLEFFDIYFNKKNSKVLNLGIRLFFQSDIETLQNEKIEKEISKIYDLPSLNFIN